ncbi:FAD dependent oxidoreductase [Chelatococcus asaccharovorans]|nr:FAD dependent oxidoreductase [Chelatococcus asaccharovorans]CAH1684975.1 FAD dependent oxidoreductase [Chelatococcus asaccharovorans]
MADVMQPYILSRTALERRAIDLLVIGGGVAGTFAALAAKRADPARSVVIVEQSNILGGQGTVGGVAGFVGDTARVNAIFAELVARLERAGKIDPYRSNDDRRAYDLESCGFYLQEMVAEAGIETWLHAVALDGKAQDGWVKEVLISVGPTLAVVEPAMVIDATGNALIADILGLPTRHLGALAQLPMSLYFTLWDTGRPVRPFLPEGCPRWDNDDDLPMTSLHGFADGRIEVKMKVVGFDAADGFSLSEAEIHGRRQMMGLIYHLQTRGYRGRHAAGGGKPLATYTLASVSRAIGQREGRRIIGRATLTEDDIRHAAIFDDAVAVGTYHLDFHWPDTDKRAGTGITDMVEPYHIPLGAMLPQGMHNVLCPGRSLSGDQMALSSYRAMATCAQMGFGAGIAAALASASRGSLAALDPTALRAAIKAGGQSLDLSRYGDYLRCLQLIEEIIPIAASDGDRLMLERLSNGRTHASLMKGNAVVAAALRERTAWSSIGPLEDAASLSPDTARPNAVIPDAAVPSPAVPDAVKGQVRFDTTGAILAFAEACPSSALTEDGAVGCILLKRCHRGEERWELHATVDEPGRLFALIVAGDRLRYRVLSTDHRSAVAPDLIPTAIGCAVAFAARDGRIHFWEASEDRFADIGSPAPDPQTLKRRPYEDHLLLAEAPGLEIAS